MIVNILEVVNKVKVYEGILGELRIFDYLILLDYNVDIYLEKLVWEGLLERLKFKWKSEIFIIYKEWMEIELKVF